MAVCETAVYALLGTYFVVAMIGLVISVALCRNSYWSFIFTNALAHLLVLVNMQWILAIAMNHLC